MPELSSPSSGFSPTESAISLMRSANPRSTLSSPLPSTTALFSAPVSASPKERERASRSSKIAESWSASSSVPESGLSSEIAIRHSI